MIQGGGGGVLVSIMFHHQYSSLDVMYLKIESFDISASKTLVIGIFDYEERNSIFQVRK
jgi:hypothetical protein